MMIEIAKALVQAQKNAQAVEKTSANSFHKYRYASAEAIIAEARSALSSADLALITTCSELHDHILEVRYVLLHSSGESMEFSSQTPVVEEKGRPFDKAVATALTYNLGYFLRGLLLLPRVEEGTDVDQRDDTRHAPSNVRSIAYDADSLAGQLDRASSKQDLILVAQKVKASGTTLTDEDRLKLSQKYEAKKKQLNGGA